MSAQSFVRRCKRVAYLLRYHTLWCLVVWMVAGMVLAFVVGALSLPYSALIIIALVGSPVAGIMLYGLASICRSLWLSLYRRSA